MNADHSDITIEADAERASYLRDVLAALGLDYTELKCPIFSTFSISVPPDRAEAVRAAIQQWHDDMTSRLAW